MDGHISDMHDRVASRSEERTVAYRVPHLGMEKAVCLAGLWVLPGLLRRARNLQTRQRAKQVHEAYQLDARLWLGLPGSAEAVPRRVKQA